MPNTAPNLTAIVDDFIAQVSAAVEASLVARVQATLGGAFGVQPRRGPGRPPKAAVATAAPPAKKRKKASPKVARARRLQGQYLGALRALSGADRGKVKAMAKQKGVAEAVKLALTLKKKA